MTCLLYSNNSQISDYFCLQFIGIILLLSVLIHYCCVCMPTSLYFCLCFLISVAVCAIEELSALPFVLSLSSMPIPLALVPPPCAWLSTSLLALGAIFLGPRCLSSIGSPLPFHWLSLPLRPSLPSRSHVPSPWPMVPPK